MDEGVLTANLSIGNNTVSTFPFSSSDKVSYRLALGVGLLLGVGCRVILAAEVGVWGLAGPTELEVSNDMGGVWGVDGGASILFTIGAVLCGGVDEPLLLSSLQRYLLPLVSLNSRLSSFNPNRLMNHKAFFALSPRSFSRRVA